LRSYQSFSTSRMRQSARRGSAAQRLQAHTGVRRAREASRRNHEFMNDDLLTRRSAIGLQVLLMRPRSARSHQRLSGRDFVAQFRAISFCEQFRLISFHCACSLAQQLARSCREDCGCQGSRTKPGFPGKSICWDGSAVVIVCSCNVISDHQVRCVTAEQAVRGTSGVYRCLGCSATCGRCVRTIRDIMDEVLAERTVDLPASPGICAPSEPPSF
jgi:bacterioferritin-associated ferredoxin